MTWRYYLYHSKYFLLKHLLKIVDTHEKKSLIIGLRTYLMTLLMIDHYILKLWCKSHFNDCVSKSSPDSLITGAVYESFLLLLFLFEINLCSFLFLHWSCCKLLPCNVGRMFLLMLLYSREPACWILYLINVYDSSVNIASSFCDLINGSLKLLSQLLYGLSIINWPLIFAKVGTIWLCHYLCINAMLDAALWILLV